MASSSNTVEEEEEEEEEEEAENKDEDWPTKAWHFLFTLRQLSPLIQCMTNYVSMDLTANTLLSAGASPAMVISEHEIPDFTPLVHSLYLNLGTLSAPALSAMKSAAATANRYGRPWVLDPVAAGSSGFRLRACLELVELGPAVVRGNGTEIIALTRGLAGTGTGIGATKGVDSLNQSTDALEAAKSLSQASGAIVAISGAVDIITDGQRVICAHNGVPMMQKITATGCSVTALIAAFVAVDPTQALEATALALSVFGIAGELGMETAKGPASLRVNLIDSLYALDEATIRQHLKVSSLT